MQGGLAAGVRRWQHKVSACTQAPCKRGRREKQVELGMDMKGMDWGAQAALNYVGGCRRPVRGNSMRMSEGVGEGMASGRSEREWRGGRRRHVMM